MFEIAFRPLSGGQSVTAAQTFANSGEYGKRFVTYPALMTYIVSE